MSPSTETPTTQAQVVIPTPSLQEDTPFFTEVLGMRMESIFPAEDPSVAVFSGHGIKVRIERLKDGKDRSSHPARILLFCDNPSHFSHGDTEQSKVILLGESELQL